MNLLAYSSGDYLDHLGALLGVSRLEATNATCTIRFTLSSQHDFDITIPEGTRLTPNGRLYFATSQDLIIEAGDTSGDVVAVCETSGTSGNDYVAGQINKIVDVIAYEMNAINIDASAGGTDEETDDAFRERIQIAPESFTTAGSKKGYEYFALSADSDISGVSVLTNADDPSIPAGNVYIYVLMNDGVLPDENVLSNVLAACSADDVRPCTDYVHALAPEQINYSIDVSYWIDAENSSLSANIQANVEEAVMSWVKWQRAALGRDINPSKLNHDIIAAGAKRCVINEPVFTVLNKKQAAHALTPPVISFAGLEE
mgnify:CR=1 FL=1